MAGIYDVKGTIKRDVRARTWRIRIPSIGTDVVFTLDDTTNEAFREARRKIVRDLRAELVKTGDEVILPVANARATYVRTISGQGSVIRKGRQNEIYLTTKKRGRLKDAVGYIEFGGESKTVIGPEVIGAKRQGIDWKSRKRRMSRSDKTHAGAISMPDGQARRWVTTTRHFKGKHQLAASVYGTRNEFEQLLSQRILRYFETEGFTTE